MTHTSMTPEEFLAMYEDIQTPKTEFELWCEEKGIGMTPLEYLVYLEVNNYSCPYGNHYLGQFLRTGKVDWDDIKQGHTNSECWSSHEFNEGHRVYDQLELPLSYVAEP